MYIRDILYEIIQQILPTGTTSLNHFIYNRDQARNSDNLSMRKSVLFLKTLFASRYSLTILNLLQSSEKLFPKKQWSSKCLGTSNIKQFLTQVFIKLYLDYFSTNRLLEELCNDVRYQIHSVVIMEGAGFHEIFSLHLILKRI